MKTLLIAGGTGLVGSRFIALYKDKYNIRVLSRSAHSDTDRVRYFKWDTNAQLIEQGALEDIDVIINLAGAGIADKRWTPSRKKIIVESRTKAAETFQKYLQNIIDKKPIYIGASAIGVYGDRGAEKLDENSALGEGFMAEVCKQWEAAHLALTDDVSRQIILRIGIVLSPKGGALKEIMKPARFGLYGYFGLSDIYYACIPLDELCKIIHFSIENDKVDGIVNAVNPEPITTKALLKALKAHRNKLGLVLPVPAFAMKLVLGEMAAVVLNSTRVYPKRLQTYKFPFGNYLFD